MNRARLDFGSDSNPKIRFSVYDYIYLFIWWFNGRRGIWVYTTINVAEGFFYLWYILAQLNGDPSAAISLTKKKKKRWFLFPTGWALVACDGCPLSCAKADKYKRSHKGSIIRGRKQYNLTAYYTRDTEYYYQKQSYSAAPYFANENIWISTIDESPICDSSIVEN